MKDTDIDRIAEAIAAKLGEPGGAQLLGCGDASSSQTYSCTGYHDCNRNYECGGAGRFECSTTFRCVTGFECDSNFYCIDHFGCRRRYNE